MKIYQALYNPCVHESAYATISLHKTENGARMAMEKHKKEKLHAFNEMYKDEPDFEKYNIKFGQHEEWDVQETELLD